MSLSLFGIVDVDDTCQAAAVLAGVLHTPVCILSDKCLQRSWSLKVGAAKGCGQQAFVDDQLCVQTLLSASYLTGVSV